MCPSAMVGWHFQFGMSRCSEYAFSYLYLLGVFFSWFSMMKPGWILSHPGTLKKAPLSAKMLDLNILSELNTVPSSFKSV